MAAFAFPLFPATPNPNLYRWDNGIAWDSSKYNAHDLFAKDLSWEVPVDQEVDEPVHTANDNGLNLDMCSFHGHKHFNSNMPAIIEASDDSSISSGSLFGDDSSSSFDDDIDTSVIAVEEEKDSLFGDDDDTMDSGDSNHCDNTNFTRSQLCAQAIAQEFFNAITVVSDNTTVVAATTATTSAQSSNTKQTSPARNRNIVVPVVNDEHATTLPTAQANPIRQGDDSDSEGDEDATDAMSTSSTSSSSEDDSSSSDSNEEDGQSTSLAPSNTNKIIAPRFPGQKPDFSTASLEVLRNNRMTSMLDSFLAEMVASNAELANNGGASASGGFKITNLDREEEEEETDDDEGMDGSDEEEEGQYIEMNLGLGVLEEKVEGQSSDSSSDSESEVEGESLLARLANVQGEELVDRKGKGKRMIEEISEE